MALFVDRPAINGSVRKASSSSLLLVSFHLAAWAGLTTTPGDRRGAPVRDPASTLTPTPTLTF